MVEHFQIPELLWTQNYLCTVYVVGLCGVCVEFKGMNEFLFFFFFFFSVWPLPVPRGHSNCSSPPQRPMTSDSQGFSIPDFIHYTYYLNSWERASIFPFGCSVLNKGTTGTIFFNVFGMTRSLTGDWTRDLPHLKPALYH